MPRETIARLKEQIELQRIEIEFLKSAGEDGIKMKDAEIQQLQQSVRELGEEIASRDRIIDRHYRAFAGYRATIAHLIASLP